VDALGGDLAIRPGSHPGVILDPPDHEDMIELQMAVVGHDVLDFGAEKHPAVCPVGPSASFSGETCDPGQSPLRPNYAALPTLQSRIDTLHIPPIYENFISDDYHRREDHHGKKKRNKAIKERHKSLFASDRPAKTKDDLTRDSSGLWGGSHGTYDESGSYPYNRDSCPWKGGPRCDGFFEKRNRGGLFCCKSCGSPLNPWCRNGDSEYGVHTGHPAWKPVRISHPPRPSSKLVFDGIVDASSPSVQETLAPTSAATPMVWRPKKTMENKKLEFASSPARGVDINENQPAPQVSIVEDDIRDQPVSNLSSDGVTSVKKEPTFPLAGFDHTLPDLLEAFVPDMDLPLFQHDVVLDDVQVEYGVNPVHVDGQVVDRRVVMYRDVPMIKSDVRLIGITVKNAKLFRLPLTRVQRYLSTLFFFTLDTLCLYLMFYLGFWCFDTPRSPLFDLFLRTIISFWWRSPNNWVFHWSSWWSLPYFTHVETRPIYFGWRSWFGDLFLTPYVEYRSHFRQFCDLMTTALYEFQYFPGETWFTLYWWHLELLRLLVSAAMFYLYDRPRYLADLCPRISSLFRFGYFRSNFTILLAPCLVDSLYLEFPKMTNAESAVSNIRSHTNRLATVGLNDDLAVPVIDCSEKFVLHLLSKRNFPTGDVTIGRSVLWTHT
jgi:hypothetical protein